MKRDIYKSIYETIGSREDLYDISKQNPSISFNTLLAVYLQKYQEYTRKNSFRHNKPEIVKKYYEWYLAQVKQEEKGNETPKGSLLVRLSEDISLAPCLLARYLLHHHYSLQDATKSLAVLSIALEEFESSSTITNAPSSPVKPRRDLIQNISAKVKSDAGKYLKDTSLINDERLRFEVERCIEADDVYSPYVEKIRHAIGVEYEVLLQEKLINLAIPYTSEEQLRELGYPKTPDIKLELPIMVDGHVVNWIESKASFGDDYHHAKNLRDQFWAYQNRFGPGLVIYWFGYVDDLDCHRQEGIMIMDNFPSDIVTIV